MAVTRRAIERVERATWPLIYLGLFGMGLGWAMRRGDAAELGWLLVMAGAVALVVGALLVWVRSRFSDADADRGS